MEKLAPEERQQIILDLLQSEGKVLAIDLATRLNTTEAGAVPFTWWCMVYN